MASDLACEDPFDSIDDLLDFPNEDDGRLSIVDAWGNCAPMAPSLSPAMIVAGSGGGINAGNVSGDEISSENDALGLYNEADITNLEWLSNFFEGCEFNADLIPNSIAPSSSSSSSSSSSPSSSSSSSSSCSPGAGIPGRARTKRARLPSLSALGFVAPCPSASPSPWAKKAKKEGDSPAPSARKCAHCEIQKTPQWRAGPTGPKTLCNACGVRYKSGRLFPEYRPAASPTFVPAVHSNSHKRVVEMRLRTAPCDLLHFLPARD